MNIHDVEDHNAELRHEAQAEAVAADEIGFQESTAEPWTKVELLDAVADHWGGVGCIRELNRAEGWFRFHSNDGTRHTVIFPGRPTVFREDDGRPFKGTVPDGKLRVVPQHGAPDDWFYVDVDRARRLRDVTARH